MRRWPGSTQRRGTIPVRAALIMLSTVALPVSASCSPTNQADSEDRQLNNPTDSGGPPGYSRTAPPPPPSASRKAPPKVEPIVANGVRYEQVVNAELLGEEQRTGYLAAIDEKSGERIWLLKVYNVNRVEHLEADVQDVFFASMTLSEDGESLAITDERGRSFVVDLESRTVRED